MAYAVCVGGSGPWPWNHPQVNPGVEREIEPGLARASGRCPAMPT